jgi:hypothetical protein
LAEKGRDERIYGIRRDCVEGIPVINVISQRQYRALETYK